MSDLISRSELLKEVEKYKFGAISDDAEREYIKSTILDFIIGQPTVYDIGNVVKELEELKMRYFLTIANTGDEKSDFAYENVGNALDNAIEIVKQGGVTKNCNDCANYTEHDEVDNGCYLCCKGYEDNYEPKVDNGGVSDDVCEWTLTDTRKVMPYKTSCGNEDLYDNSWKYCPHCSKKIKVVE